VQSPQAPTNELTKELAGELLALWHHLIRGSSHHMYALLSELDLSITHIKALHMLDDCGCELSVKEVAERVGYSLPAASRTVESLLRRGLLQRREDEHDRRVKRVRITAAGREVVEQIDTARLAGLEQFTETLTAEQRERLLAALRDLPHRP
jgi:DNA-binding MarR family transcriptional regulator